MKVNVDLWKIFTLVVGILIMPLSGWVWQTNLDVSELKNDLHDVEYQVDKLEVDVKEYEKNARALIGVEKDIEHIRSALSRIEELVTR
jgi:cell division protein FtsL